MSQCRTGKLLFPYITFNFSHVFKCVFILLLFNFCIQQKSIAQPGSKTRNDLEKHKNELLREIEETNNQLKLNEKNQKATKSQLAQLAKQLRTREQLIRTINNQIGNLGSEIEQTEQEIANLESEMMQLKAEYARMITFAQRNRSSYQKMMYIFASKDFLQATKRVKYFQQYSDARKVQAFRIDSVQKELAIRQTFLQNQRQIKSKLKTTEEQQKQNIAEEKHAQEGFMKNLSKQESVLRKRLAEKEATKKKLENAIAENIRKEIESVRKKAEAGGKKKDDITSKNAFSQTPEELKLSNSFASNRGVLPWPVENGEVVSTFGEHQHPVLKNVTVKNDGVDIQSSKGAAARCIFAGEVTGVINIPGSYAAVIVRHGEFLTVYSNLEGVLVRKGDKLTTKQKIGTIHCDTETNVAELNFQIWKGFTKLDPQAWLKR